jgi:hypothetical protein
MTKDESRGLFVWCIRTCGMYGVQYVYDYVVQYEVP